MIRKNGVEDLEADSVGYMPRRFVLMYHELVDQALKQQSAQQYDSGGGGRKKYHTPDGGLKSEAALAEKQRIDRALRALARDSDMATDKPKCKSCGKFVQQSFAFCPWCGYSFANVVNVERKSADVRVDPMPYQPRKLR
ncbi:hypothetical protein SEA_DRE3_60 [Gordonia phage Dre3]|uniref:Zinc ribbon domain-containing protein n=1 Tax=Gordonia phage Gibbous TaxID=2652405 RepID=A0A5J6T3X9_9CAUD|nr:hypothetical protein QLQ74_gp60 [Gordonia phage Gibbous]QFG05136.1 hypothetical protein SEA_GIBBOUS_60 [Gordonia phage Gibbous]QRI45989.1 hypothetical protein SEA_DRE3_60 [Gordonia phage Dre3]